MGDLWSLRVASNMKILKVLFTNLPARRGVYSGAGILIEPESLGVF